MSLFNRFSSEKSLKRLFTDEITVRVKAGDGGNGLVTFSSLSGKEWAGLQIIVSSGLCSFKYEINLSFFASRHLMIFAD